MSQAEFLWQQVRQRAHAACEYCGVKETDCGGLLTVDPFQPQSCGADDLANLVYCCWRCNLYKADYWQTQPGDRVLWNPRTEAAAAHFVRLADATLHGFTATGLFTVFIDSLFRSVRAGGPTSLERLDRVCLFIQPAR